MIADRASAVHATGSGLYVYNRQSSKPREATLVGKGHAVPVKCYGDLDLVVYSWPISLSGVTISGIAVVPGITLDLCSLNSVQENYQIFTDHTGTYTLDNKLHFKQFLIGNYAADGGGLDAAGAAADDGRK